MPTSKGRRPKSGRGQLPPLPPSQNDPPSRCYRFGQSLHRFLKSFWAGALVAGFLLGTFAAAYSLSPRLSADVESEPDFSSALPNSASIKNTGPVTLRNVAVSFVTCHAVSDGGSTFSGRPANAPCNGSALGIAGRTYVKDWEGHTLVPEETLPLSLPVKHAGFGKEKLAWGDVDYIVTFWAWPIPLYQHTAEFRFATQKQPNGKLIWAPLPVD